MADRLDDFVESTFGDLTSSFLVLPKGPTFVEYPLFDEAYENLKRHTDAFRTFTQDDLWAALCQNSLSLLVVRTVLGMTPPEWAELTRQEEHISIDQSFTRALDKKVKRDPEYIGRLRRADTLGRIRAMIRVACRYISQAVPLTPDDTIHRLRKIDTAEGLASLRHVATLHVPYAALLYERYLGRPFASHRDAVSERVGDVMESAIESLLHAAQITSRKTARAERVPGFAQAPDFIIPNELAPRVVIEAKVAGDDGTARDKVSRILRLCSLGRDRGTAGNPGFQVVACIDGRGFGIGREDMRQLLLATDGKVFTLATLDQVIEYTDLKAFIPTARTST